MASPSLALTLSIALSLYMGFILFFVFRGAQKTKSITDYAVGSIRFSPIVVGLSFAGSFTSAATFIINPGFIALYGISALFAMGIAIPLGMFCSLIVLTKAFRKYGKTVNARTLAEWIGKRYDSKYLSIFFGFLSLLLITFMVLICVGLTKVLSKALNVEEIWVLLFLVLFIFGYMMFGGINSMVYTNTVQVAVMIIVAIILVTSGYEHFSEGIQSFMSKLKSIDPDLIHSPNIKSPLYRDYFEIFFCNFLIGVAAICMPHVITRSLIIKKEKDVNKFLTTVIVVQVLFFTVLLAGLYARLQFPDLEVNGSKLKMDGIMPAYVVNKFPDFLGLFVVMGLISAGLSTLENLIQSIPTSITTDVIDPLFYKKVGDIENKEIRLNFINKLVIGMLGIVTLLLSCHQLTNPKLSVAIFAQAGVYAYFAAAFIPVLFGIFLKNVPKFVVVVASVSAIIVHFSSYFGRIGFYMQGDVKNPAVSAAIAILVSAFIGIVLYVFYRKKENTYSQ